MKDHTLSKYRHNYIPKSICITCFHILLYKTTPYDNPPFKNLKSKNKTFKNEKTKINVLKFNLTKIHLHQMLIKALTHRLYFELIKQFILTQFSMNVFFHL